MAENNFTTNNNDNLDLNNYFEDDNCEVIYYDTAFPSLRNSDSDCIQNNNNSNLTSTSLSNSNSNSKSENNKPSTLLASYLSSQSFTTDTFIIPSEERNYLDEDNSSSTSNFRRILKDICGQNNVRLETSVQANQSLRVFITGVRENVNEAKKKIRRVLQTQHSMVINIPKEYHRILIGAKGVKLKEIEKNTFTQITIPKPTDNSDSVTIKGTKDNVENARQTIQKLVDEVSKIGREIIEIDKRFHQLVCHKSNTSLHVVLERKNLRLDIPPLSVNANEISVSGDKEGVSQAASIIRQVYEEMKNTYQELQIEIPREKHRYIIGPKGSGIKEILDKTQVWVQINSSVIDSSTGKSDSSSSSINAANTVTLLGPKSELGSALTEIFRKSESFDVVTISAPGWLHKFIIGKSGDNLRAWTADKPDLNISFDRSKNEIVVEGTTDDVSLLSSEIKSRVFELESQLSKLEMEIDQTIIKHLIGAGGSNIQKIQAASNCSINLTTELSPARTIIVVIGAPDKIEIARSALEKSIDQIVNTKKLDVIFRNDLIPKLIGQNGRGLKPIKDEFPDVRIIMPSQDSKNNIITLLGPRNDVDKFGDWLKKKQKELVECNFAKTLKISHKYHKMIIGREGITIRELIKATNTNFNIPPSSEEKDEITIIGKQSDVEAAEKKVLSIVQKEQNIIEVHIEIPKNLHTILIGKGGSRVNALKEECGGQVSVRFPTPDSTSNTVIVKGLREDVSIAQTRLRELVEEITNSNYECDFTPSGGQEHLAFLMMNQEMKLRNIREKYRIRISEGEDKAHLHLVGAKEKVLSVIKFLEQVEKDAGELVTEKLKLPIEHIHYFQQTGELTWYSRNHYCRITIPHDSVKTSSVSKEITDQTGTNLKKQSRKKKSQYEYDEKMGADGFIEFKGPKSYVESAKKEIEKVIDDYENSVTDSILIDSKQYENITRYSKEELNEITYKYSVNIEFVPNNSKLDSQFKSAGIVNGNADSISEEESIKSLSSNHSLSAHSPSLPNGHHINNCDDNSSGISSDVQILHANSVAVSKLPKFRVLLNGRPEKNSAAIEEIVKLLLVDLEVPVPPEYFPKIIGVKGARINELRTKHNVQILIPTSPSQSNASSRQSSASHTASKSPNVIVSGPSERARQARMEILDIVDELNKQKEEREKKNFRLILSVSSKHHRALIGAKGTNISKIRNKYSVKISVPTNNDPSSDEIVIQGPKEAVYQTKDEILNFIRKLENQVIEDLKIDHRIHSRLIGSRGVNLDRYRKKYKCEIVFPIRGSEGEEADIVKIKGTKESVDLCADDLIDKAKELLDQLEESEPLPNHVPTVSSIQLFSNTESSLPASHPAHEIQIRNAPWQLNWADTRDDDEEEELYNANQDALAPKPSVVMPTVTSTTPAQNSAAKWSNIVGGNK